MYSVVLLAALSAADGSVGAGLHVAYPVSHCPNCGCTYGAGHGAPKGGDFWPGYSGWGGCGGYASPAYGVPMTPLVTPLPKRPVPPDEKLDDGAKKKTPDDGEDADRPKRRKPKPDDEEELNGKTAALITIFLPAGAKLTVDGRTVTASGVKTFITPPLEKGAAYSYEVNIETKRDGKPVVVTKRLRVTAGESVHADYREFGESVTAKK